MEEKDFRPKNAKIGYYCSFTTPVDKNYLSLEEEYEVPSLFGKRKMKVVKMDEASATLEDEFYISYAKKEEGQWVFTHTLVDKKVCEKVLLI